MNKLKYYLIIAIVLFVTFIPNTMASEVGDVTEFNYTGNYQEWVVPESGIYKIELWGAQGGNNNTLIGGYGGYTAGSIFLKRGTKLYVYVGQRRYNTADATTFNGARATSGGYPSGGATDIRLEKGSDWKDFDSLKSRIMVAGGGGSGHATSAVAGAGGGLIGKAGKGTKGGTQTSSTNGESTFGKGGFGYGGGGAAGGSGYYGAGGAYNATGAGGGSSFISGHNGCDAIYESSTVDNIKHTGQPNHYSGYVFTDTVMIDGDGYVWTNVMASTSTGMPTWDGTGTMTGNANHGHAKMTLISKKSVKSIEVKDAIVEDIDNNNFNVFISGKEVDTEVLAEFYTTYDYITGLGDVTLTSGSKHYITAIDRTGDLILITLNIIEKPVSVDIEFENIELDFDAHKFEYSFDVDFDTRNVTPIVTIPDTASYEVEGANDLRVGKNKVIVRVSEGSTSTEYVFIVTRDKRPNYTYEFDYTGEYQEWVAPKDGNYVIELWGAQGGNQNNAGGLGAYTKGTIYLNQGTTLYVYVGQRRGAYANTTTFNGSTGSSGGWPGGGATDIRLVKTSSPTTWKEFESLKSRIMVAASGGSSTTGTPGAAGGLIGKAGGYNNPGTQTSGGRSQQSSYPVGGFGYGGGGASGGSGYYGAGGADNVSGASGGSSFISGHNGCDAIAEASSSFTSIIHTGQPNHYSGYVFTDTVMIDGNGYQWTNVIGSIVVNMPTHDGRSTMTGNSGNGYAKITLANEESNNNLLESITITDKDGNDVLNEEGNPLDLEFNPLTNEYSITLNEDATTLIIDALAQDKDAHITGLREYSISTDTTDIEIMVTAPSGDVNTYVIHVKREASTNPYLAGIRVNGFLLEDFLENKFEYEVELPYYMSFAIVEVVKQNDNQTVTGDGLQILVNNEAETHLLVVSEDGKNNKRYTIHFTKEKTTLLDQITFREISKIYNLIDNKFDYDLDLTLLNHSLTLDILPYYEGVNIKIEGNKYLGEKSKVITVTSSLEGLPDSVYTFNVNYLTQDEKYSFEFPYTGDVQKFIAPASQYYDIELWGAQGGNGNVLSGHGGYTKGKIFLEKDTELYVYVGEMRKNVANSTTFNGSIANSGGWPGGGATDVRLVQGTTWKEFNSLKTRIMVAAGGGTTTTGTAGPAGGLVGYPGGINNPGTQTSAGGVQRGAYLTAGFGYGGGGASGGGGYYGGGASDNVSGAGGGSSFISGHNGSNAIAESSTVNKIVHTGQSIHYSGYSFIDTKMIDGKGYLWTNVKTDLELMPKPSGGYYSLGQGNQGNGYAKIQTSEFVSNDNYLDTLVIKSGEDVIALNPTFEPWEQEFNVSLDKNQSKINISATPKDLLATIMGTGDLEVAPGESDIEIVVTAQDGSTRTYVIHLTREADNDPYPENIKVNRMPTYLCKVNAEYCKYIFDKTTTEYNINLPYAVREIELLVTPKSKWQTINYYTSYDFANPDNNTPIETDGVFGLDDEVTTIYIEVISEDGAFNTVYTYNFFRDVRGNNNLESITITNPDIAIENFDPYTYEYYLTLPKGFSFDIEAIPERKEKTKVEIENTILTEEPYKTSVNNLVQGMNNVIITVTAENGDTKTYILHIYKGFESDVLLNTLTVTNGSNTLDLTPTFDNRINDYTLSVGSDVTEVNINATARDTSGTTVTGTGIKTLKSGVNNFQVEVKSKTLNDDNEYDTNIYNITIYKDMSSNASISNITVDGHTMNPLYNKDEHEYYIDLDSGETSVNVNVVMEDKNATYTVRGNNNLNKAMNEIVVTGIAEDKTYVVYKIYAYKNVSDNNDLASLNYKIDEDFISVPDFDKDTTNYTINVSGDTRKIEIEAIPEDILAMVTGDGVYYLNTGDNTITINVTSESGEVKTYTIKVVRAKNDDVTLKEVTNNRGSEVTKVDNSEYDYLINVQYEVNNIEIKGVANADTSVVSGNGTYNLNPGDNMIILRVTSEAGTSRDYKVKVVRDLSNNDDLAFLYIEEGGLSPNFNRTTIYYDVKVPNSVTNLNELHIEVIPEDKDASVVINGNDGELEVGIAKEFTVTVTAPNKIDTKTYTISVTRQESTTDNLGLEALTTNRGDLIPTFNPDTLNYELTVENNITDITVNAKSFSENVKIEGIGTYNLNVGKNAIAVFVIGESGVQRDYQIVVTRKKSSNATLSNLVVKGHTLSPTFKSEVTSYSLNTSKEYLEFTTIKPTENEATYTIVGNTSFKTGVNEVKIIVTAPDGETTKEYVINATKAGSKNNNLASLKVLGYNLTPTFHKGVTFYAVDIPNNINSIMIEATAEDVGATITGDGLKQVITGENYFDIVVTSESNTKKTYTILVTKDASDNNYLATLFASEGTFNKTFIKTDNNYEITVPYDISEIEFYGTVEDIGATVVGFEKYNLNVGENNIEITVVSESGKINIYNIKVIRESVISAYLTDIKVGDFLLDPEFNKEIFEYFVTVDNEVTSLDLEYVKEDSNAIVTVSGNENFSVGMNEIHINVTREISDSEVLEQEYIIYVNRQMSTNNYLSSLIVSEGVLTPEFDKNTLSYKVSVPSDISEITVSATTEDSSSKITTGIGKHTLNPGVNTILVKVRSSVGIIRTYTIEVTREESTNNKLLDIIVKTIDGKVISPDVAFDKDTNNYIYNLDLREEFVVISIVKGDNYQNVIGEGPKELVPGVNTFDIVVTAQNGDINTYTLTINNPLSDNNYALNIVPSSGTLSPEFTKENTTYSLEVEDVSSLAFNVTLESNSASVTGHEIKALPEGDSVRVITVKAEDGSTREYTINVTRPSKSEARLENLEVEGYPFEFEPDTFTYNIQVSNSKKKLLESEITAIAKDKDATINMMGDLDLTDGIVNIYTIEVIAKDGYTTQTYELLITRDSADYTLRTNKYEIVRFEDEAEEDYVIGIQPSTVISDFKNNFENEPEMLHVYLENEVSDTDLTATAFILKLEKDGYVYDTLRVIVRGDLTKDGKVNITDQVKMINYVGRTTTFDKYQMLAGDLTFDGKVNITDQVKIINYVGRTISDLNNKPTS